MKTPKTISSKHILLAALLPVAIWFYFCLPDPLFDTPYSTVLLDKDAKLLGATVAQDEQWRFPESTHVPEKFEQSILHFEDQHFYWHPGINPVSMAKAIYQNYQAGDIVRGGSTLSMQVIRLARQGKPRTYWEKLYECIMALRLELRYSKAEILQLYASYAPFGGNVVGLEAASWRYYNRPPDKLSWGEAAALAVLPNAPALVFPGKNHELLKTKRDRLLEKLSENDILTKTEAELAKSEPLPGKPHPLPETAPHVLANFQGQNPGGGIYQVAVEERTQKLTTMVVEKYHRLLAQNEIHNAAVLVVDTRTGAVKAYVGNTSDEQSENENAVDIITAPRSSGSTLKPFLYAKMLESGQLLPQTLLPDIPTYISGYAPKNFDEKFDGAVPADAALARSLNVPAVRMLQDYGVEIFHHDLQKMGFPTINRTAGNYGLSLILGGAEVTLWDLVGNYRKLALSLNKFHENAIELNQIYLLKPQKILNKLPFGPASSWLTLSALSEMDRPLEGADWRMYQSSKTIAWKTGTSFGHKDAWAVGITPDYIVGVWVGNADGEGRPGLTGASTAAPLMFDVFDKLPGSSWFQKPEAALRSIKVCSVSGYKSTPVCEKTKMIEVAEAGEQTELCPYHYLVHLDNTAQLRVNANCYAVSKMVAKSWFVLPPIMEWYYKRKNPHYKELPAFMASCVPETNNLDIIYPQANASLFIPKSFEGKKESLVFEATHRKSATKLYWHIDDKFIASTTYNHQLELQPVVGEHVLTIVSEQGESISRKFHVIN